MNKVKEYDAISIGDSISIQLNPDEDEYDDEALSLYLDSEYIESNFTMDSELDLGEAPTGDYAILDTKDWLNWYYIEPIENLDDLSDKSLSRLDKEEIDSLLDDVDYGLIQPTGLFDSQVLTSIQINVGTLEEIKKGFAHVCIDNFLFLHTILRHKSRTIPLIPTKMNPSKEQIIPEYFVVKWAKLNKNYNTDEI